MLRTTEIRDRRWHETCKCKYRLDASVGINSVGIKINADANVKN